MSDQKVKKRIIPIIGKHIRKEMKRMCGLKSISLLRDSTPQRLCSFKWEDLMKEMQQTAPTFFQILEGCVYRKQKGVQMKKSYRVNDESVIGICAAILLRHKNPKMNLIQRIISMLLYGSHAPKNVS